MTGENITLKKLPEAAWDVISRYENISIGSGKSVRCPYYRNPSSGDRRWGLIVFSGKGSPQEIEEELVMLEKLEGVNFSVLHEEEIQRIMRKYRLGVDCSGFVAHVLDKLLMVTLNKPITKVMLPGDGFLDYFKWYFRPYSHLSVQLLVSKRNAYEVSLNEIRPGDMIVFFGNPDHVALVTETGSDGGVLMGFKYAHAALEDESGFIKQGSVELKPGETLSFANISEVPDTGRVITQGRNQPSFFRLKALKGKI